MIIVIFEKVVTPKFKIQEDISCWRPVLSLKGNKIVEIVSDLSSKLCQIVFELAPFFVIKATKEQDI